MKLYLKIWALLIIIALGGCESTIELDSSEFKPQLSIFGNFSPSSDNRIQVEILQTKFASDNTTFETPEGLEVFITTEKIKQTIKLQQDPNMRSQFATGKNILEPETKYIIEVHAPGFESACAETIIPEKSEVGDFEVFDVVVSPSEKSEFQSNVRYKARFNINNEVNNQYFHILFFNSYSSDPDFAFSLEPEYTDKEQYLQHYEVGILVDLDKITGDFYEFQFNDWVIENEFIENVYVELRSVTEEYYLYHESLSKQKIARQDPFAEPISIYNNIKNGVGNFAGYNVSYVGATVPR